MEKDLLVVLIVGLTVLLVTVWISVDFCVYRKRKRDAREKKIFMFYHYGRRKRLAFPNTIDTKRKKLFTGNDTQKRKKPWKRVMNLFRRQKAIDTLTRHAQSASHQKEIQSEKTSSGVSEYVSDHYNSMDMILENLKENFDQLRSDKNSSEITKKRNSITPSDILPPNRMALSPVEMQSVFSVKDEATLYSSDFDEHSVSSKGSFCSSSVGDSVKIENESDTAFLTKRT